MLFELFLFTVVKTIRDNIVLYVIIICSTDQKTYLTRTIKVDILAFYILVHFFFIAYKTTSPKKNYIYKYTGPKLQQNVLKKRENIPYQTWNVTMCNIILNITKAYKTKKSTKLNKIYIKQLFIINIINFLDFTKRNCSFYKRLCFLFLTKRFLY